ncbi:hypothetical protein [Sulfurovum sp. NBC37-1]|uniref:rhamnosyltransferase WsaF family glycosyltransferase n=1 Tax=Sulfurovum sp. (strain NBC37-1) TaxID=387093 RepID=UPI000158799B|nr:hypothetical protein [Sulfurovum sp. NBC37-1]BAF72680.1 hypothetical protein SUN_1733 [Sulfurovum sp. NBC37-1]
MFNFRKKNNQRKNEISFLIKDFDAELYLEANPDVRKAIKEGQFEDAVHHLKVFGLKEIEEGERKFHKDLDAYNESDYLNSFPEAKVALENEEVSSIFEHFCKVGYQNIVSSVNFDKYEEKDGENIEESDKLTIEPYFDKEWYQKMFNVYDICPIEHFLRYGSFEGKNPNPDFDVEWYLNEYPDVKESGLNPFIHFIQFGKAEGKFQNPDEKYLQENIKIIEPYFDKEWYQKMFNVYDICPIEHFLRYGSFEGKNPNPDFDVEWYLNEYPDVKESSLNSFVHFIQFGKVEGRFQNVDEKDRSILNQKIKKYFQRAENNIIDLNIDSEKEHKENFFDYLYSNKRGNLKKVKIDSNIKLLSLDIWDTILRRKCHPDEIKLSAARYLHINYLKILKPAYRDINSLYNLRKKSEDLSSLTDDYEFRYEEAVDKWLVEAFETGVQSAMLIRIKKKLLNHELKAELRSTEKDASMDIFLKKLKFKNVIFASDFYMPNTFMQKLLRKNNVIRHFTKGYVSCDLIKNKRSGKLYKHILEEFQLEPNELFHIGDNKHADVDVPSKLGIGTFHYEDNHEKMLHKWFEDAFYEKLSGETLLHGKRVFNLCNILSKKSIFNASEKIGAKLAPIAIGYILHIIEEAKRLNVETIYFFTREGIFLKEIYDLVVEADPYYLSYPKSELLEVSRLATFAPSLAKVNVENLMKLWNQYSIQSPKAFCASLNVDNMESKKVFKKYGFRYFQKIKYPWENKKFVKLIESSAFQDIVKKYIDVQRRYIKQYLKQKGLNQGKSVSMIVDLGWRGTIQDNISMLVDEHVHGCYLGLFNYLNRQEEVSKCGWLFDNNIQENDWTNHEVGPIEMLFNSLGGSTIGYESKDGTILAVKKEERAEDNVFVKYTSYFQSGIKKVIPEVIEYIAIHGLTSSDLKDVSRQIAKQLLANPPVQVAEAFFELTHNETFGTGKYQTMDVDQDFVKNLKSKKGSVLYHYVSRHLDSVRWKEGYLNIPKVQKAICAVKSDLTNTPLAFYSKFFLNDKKLDFRVAIYAPAPIAGSGGHRTLFNLASKFVEAGCDVYCFLEEEGAGVEVAYDYMRENRAHVLVGWPKNSEFDMAVATIAHSSKLVAGLKNVRHKAYLVQDFEAWFNPMGDIYSINENSYTFGNLHFTVGSFLTHLLHHQYNARAVPAGLGIDTNVYFNKGGEREDAISFLYQPEKFRRNPQMAIEALRIVKEKNPDIKIYVYGSDADLHLDFEVENLGLIYNISKLNDLYNKCKVGLCISMTNPSRIPFEFMAAGVVAVDIYRYNNLIDYPTGTIKLAYQSPESIAKAILQVFKDEEEFKKRQKAGIVFASTRTLDWEMDTFVNNALKVMNGMPIDRFDVECNYDEKPIISRVDNRKEVRAFCTWQKRLATI